MEKLNILNMMIKARASLLNVGNETRTSTYITLFDDYLFSFSFFFFNFSFAFAYPFTPRVIVS